MRLEFLLHIVVIKVGLVLLDVLEGTNESLVEELAQLLVAVATFTAGCRHQAKKQVKLAVSSDDFGEHGIYDAPELLERNKARVPVVKHPEGLFRCQSVLVM